MLKPTNKELIEKYKKLIAEQKEYIKQQCFDFSQISAVNKRALNEFIRRGQTEDVWLNLDNNIVLDNFLILKGLYTIKQIREKHPYYKKNNTTFTRKDYQKNRTLAHNVTDNDKAYTYSTKHTRELLYLCSLLQFNDNTTLLDKVFMDISLENVDLYNPSVNLTNIKFIVDNLNIEYICVDILK